MQNYGGALDLSRRRRLVEALLRFSTQKGFKPRVVVVVVGRTSESFFKLCTWHICLRG